MMLSSPWQGERSQDRSCCQSTAPNGAVTPGYRHSTAGEQRPSYPQTKSSKGLLSQNGSAFGALKHLWLLPLQCHSTAKHPSYGRGVLCPLAIPADGILLTQWRCPSCRQLPISHSSGPAEKKSSQLLELPKAQQRSPTCHAPESLPSL